MSNQPLADKVRPTSFDDIVGQAHLFGKNGTLRRICEQGYLPNMIFFGPPGTGKTTAANIIADSSHLTLHKLNATSASTADIKSIIAETNTFMGSEGILLYIDEIQYFNKKQQQSLLEYIENGRITLIASTTENPYLYIYNAIISRSAIFEFKAVSETDMTSAAERALKIINSETGMNKTADKDVIRHIAACSAGDVRRCINLLENAYYTCDKEITKDAVDSFSPKIIGNFDRNSNVHYDLLSALQKSIRGSDPDAAVFYLAKLLEGGDLIGACRRLQVIASEDVGLAYPSAPMIVYCCVKSAMDLGMPEARIPLAHAAVMLATAPKSNSAYLAYEAAKSAIDSGKGQTIPAYMSPVHRYKNYLYPHDYPDHYVKQQYLPDDIANEKFYKFGENKTENAAMEYWKKIKGDNK